MMVRVYPRYRRPTVAEATIELSTAKDVREPYSDGRISDRLRWLLLIWLHHQSLSASRILVGGP
jgi:hypothetical protein